MLNHMLVLSYDGTAYHGFQKQKNALSIQEVIESGLGSLYNINIKAEGASRTDTGVHARGQVINFFAPESIPVDRLPFALNGILPPDIVVYKAFIVEDSFSARKNARRKKYTYLIDNGLFSDVFLRNYAWHLPVDLDLDAMRNAAAYLIGSHNFKAFQAAGSSVSSTVRTLYTLEITREDHLVCFFFEGSGFLYRMVRNITGTLVDIGIGKRKAPEMGKILLAKKRSKAGETAPSKGLYLEEVIY